MKIRKKRSAQGLRMGQSVSNLGKKFETHLPFVECREQLLEESMTGAQTELVAETGSLLGSRRQRGQRNDSLCPVLVSALLRRWAYSKNQIQVLVLFIQLKSRMTAA